MYLCKRPRWRGGLMFDSVTKVRVRSRTHTLKYFEVRCPRQDMSCLIVGICSGFFVIIREIIICFVVGTHSFWYLWHRESYTSCLCQDCWKLYLFTCFLITSCGPDTGKWTIFPIIYLLIKKISFLFDTY